MSALSHSLHPTPARALELQKSLSDIRACISAAVASSIHPTLHPILVAVSKYKPASDIAGAYQANQRDFGENYVNEVLEKAPVLPSDIRWHFIGHLQTNKAKALAAIPNLHTLHSLTSIKLATALNKARSSSSILNVLLQINTSGEATKSGMPPLLAAGDSSNSGTVQDEDGVVAVARHVISSCPNLRLVGLMTIGSLDNSLSSDEGNKDFQTLLRTRAILESVLKREFPMLEGEQSRWGNQGGGLLLSMGMSSDFEAAIRAGSGMVRVGTGIFGERNKKGETDPNAQEAT